MRVARLASAFVVVAAACLARSPEARADDDPNVVRYTVKKGEDCPAVAASAFGDRSRVDLVHALNPDLGPVPHHLREGQVLLLPKALSGPPGPDATLTRVKNKVEVRAPELRAPAVPDPLFAGNRVSTQTASTADLRFRDETQVRLGESSLIVILGSSATKSPITPAATATLLDGSMRARLSALAGRLPEKPGVETPSARVAMKEGESQISVDPKKTTRLAVYTGGSAITAQKKTVPVDGGFGSKAESGSPPTPPRPLPPAPVWSAAPAALALFEGDATDVTGDYGPGTGPGDPAAEWHVQLAKDAAFDDVIVDARVPANVTRLEARALTAGRYFARVSAIDADAFEGPWSEARGVTAVRVETSPMGRRRTRVVPPAGLVCTLDGAPLRDAVDVARVVPHEVVCAAAEGSGAEAKAMLALSAMPVTGLRAQIEVIERRATSGVMRVRVTDDAGEPIEGVVPSITPPRGVEVGPVEPEGAPGTYRVEYRSPGLRRGALKVSVLSLSVETNEADLVHEPPPPRKTRLEIMVAGGGSLRGLSQAGFSGRAGADAVFPVGRGAVAVGGVFALDHHPLATLTIDENAASARASVTWIGGRIPIELRPRVGSGVTGHVAIGPEVGRQSTDAGGITASALTLGVWVAGGAGVEVGPGRAFVELSLRGAAPVGGDAQPAASTVGLGLGFRFRP
ncbi:MAG: FecR domain-containing protein [Deltaproteobacteria bacterium]|nr:FecR domain-containing protein [Deltaproteobacteria bacterium]